MGLVKNKNLRLDELAERCAGRFKRHVLACFVRRRRVRVEEVVDVHADNLQVDRRRAYDRIGARLKKGV